MTVRIHYQISEEERERRSPDAFNDRFGKKNRASYMHRTERDIKQGSHNTGHRSWSNSRKDRYNGGYTYFGPGWMLPRVVATITASIIWGTCGAMADMPEY